MGRKGVSKRKASKTKSQPLSNVTSSGSVSSVLKATESQPVRTMETGKAASTPSKEGGKPAKSEKKNSRKG